MKNYSARIISEFEDILLKMSKNDSVTYNDAYLQAVKYANEFSTKKKLSADDESKVFDLCLDLVVDWFPDTASVLF